LQFYFTFIAVMQMAEGVPWLQQCIQSDFARSFGLWWLHTVEHWFWRLVHQMT